MPCAHRDLISMGVSVEGCRTERQHGAITEIGDGVLTYPVEYVWMGAPYTLKCVSHSTVTSSPAPPPVPAPQCRRPVVQAAP